MSEIKRAIVLLDLVDPGEFKRIAMALHAEGIEARGPSSSNEGTIESGTNRTITWLDEEVRLSEADFVLIDAGLWRNVGFDVKRSLRSYVIVVLVGVDEQKMANEFVKAGVFDGIMRGGAHWEEGIASYFHVLAGLWRRFSGAFGHLERRYEDLVHSLPDIVYELDEAGRFTFVNNSIRLLGYEPADLAGKHFSFLLDEEEARNVDRDNVLAWFRGARTGPAQSPKLFNERRAKERRTENLELRIKKRAGHSSGDLIGSVTSYGEVTAAGEWSRGTTFVGTVGVIRDITLRRKSEEMLRKLYQAVDQLAAGVLVADIGFVVEYANPAFLRMALHEPIDVIGSSLLGSFGIPEKRVAEIEGLVREGFDVREEVELLVRGGERLWVAWHASPVREPSRDVSHVIVICEDVSQTRAMADLLRGAKEEAERADRAKSDFLASIGHELKGPLASIVAAARLVGMECPAQEKHVATIIDNAENLLGLFGDILDFIRFETGTPPMRMLAFPLGNFVRKNVEPWVARASEKGLAFDLVGLDDTVILSDPDRLGRAFTALLSNAISFTDQGTIRVEARVETKSGNVPYLVLSISDTGPGIPEADQARIFSPFVQLAPPYAKTAGGAGIGLSLARNIVRALGGEIRLTSKAGAGSKFTIIVPAGEFEEAGASSGSPDEHRVYRLLVVDDNEINREYMTIIFGNIGHKVDSVGNGVDALRKLEEVQPDAVILDIQMPGMSGIELGRKVRTYVGDRYDSAIPLIALTAFGPEDVQRSSVDFDRIFSKPADIPLLLSSIDAAVAKREVEAPDFFERRWSSRPAGGTATLARAEVELPPLFTALVAASRDGDRDALRQAAQSIALRVAPVGAVSLERAVRRLALASTSEDLPILSSRAERLSDRWLRVLAVAKAGSSSQD